MKSAACLAAGLSLLKNKNEERLREKAGDGAIVLVGVAHPVSVELDIVVVEVEIRRMVEPAIGIRIVVLIHLLTPGIEPYFCVLQIICSFP